jgi:alpha-glucosidase (family GH31 glycosyl hydrolase)
MTATRARLPLARFSVNRFHGWLMIRTSRLVLSYRIGSGAFSTRNLRLRLRGRHRTAHPVPASNARNLGGWTRALDNQAVPVPLHPGLLSRNGWYVLDDTATVLLTRKSPGFAVRPRHVGAYEDWYLFGYGRDYARGMGDLRALTGPAPLLPRTAFGVWFSRYYPYSESDYHALLEQFRRHRVPLDTLSVDTDFKRENNAAGAAAAATVAGAPGRPYSWNGWEWDTKLFPDPPRFISWAHGHGLSLAINIHPSIDSKDPRYPATVSRGGPLTADSGCRVLEADPVGTCETFNWSSARQLAAYFALHRPFARQGIDMFWLDWCCEGPQPAVPGLTADTWINSRYAAEQRSRGQRWPAFSRIGGAYAESNPDGPDNDRAAPGIGAYAEHRSTIQFTGDTCATWSMLAFEAKLSASEGNIGLPYVSHDIGSYNGVPGNLPCGSADIATLPIASSSRHLPDDIYARWVQFGTFQPLDRLHSNHGDRLPWEYASAADSSATRFLQLREALDPYTYTLARRSYDSGLPITGALYLAWPARAGAYRRPSEYTFGPDIVVAPVTSPGDPARVTMWVPPGVWRDYFTRRRFRGPRVVTLSVPLTRMPVLVRAGAIIPTQPYAPFTSPGPARTLTLTAFPGSSGRFRLYDDQGVGFGYRHGRFSWTTISQRRRGGRVGLTIGRAVGHFAGALRKCTWRVALVGVKRPHAVRVAGRRLRGWHYVAATRTLTVGTGAVSTRRALTITVR